MTAPGPVVTGQSGRGPVFDGGLPGSAVVSRRRPRPTTKGDAAIATDDARINDRIRARQVRLIGADGTQLGVKPLPEALHIAREQGLDLVEVAAKADPPVCKIMDFGKYKYEQDQRRKESRRKASNVVIKEMKFRPKIDGHDYDDQDEARRALPRRGLEGQAHDHVPWSRDGSPRARAAHPRAGRRTGRRARDRSSRRPRQDGRNMTMVLNPTRRPKGKGQGAAQGRTEVRRRHGRAARPTAGPRRAETAAPPKPPPEHRRRNSPTDTPGNRPCRKMKTHRGAAKRFKVTGTGKILRRKAFRAHLLEKKSTRAHAPARPPGRGHRRRPQARRALAREA